MDISLQGWDYPKVTDQSIENDGHNIDQSLCGGFTEEGLTRGAPVAIVDNLDYGNAFVRHYEAGDIQVMLRSSIRCFHLAF